MECRITDLGVQPFEELQIICRLCKRTVADLNLVVYVYLLSPCQPVGFSSAFLLLVLQPHRALSIESVCFNEVIKQSISSATKK